MIRRLTTQGLLLSTFCALVIAADSDPAPNRNVVLVEIDGVKLTLAEIEAKRPPILFQARNNFYEAQRKAVEEFAGDFLLERQAQKEKVTVAELLERHVNSAVGKDPSEEALRVYFEGIDTAESYEAVRDRIVDAIRQRRLAKAKTTYLQSLRAQAKVSFLLGPPRAPLSLKDTPVRGAPNAPVTIVEYADYECPYCQQIQPAVELLQREYKDKVAIAYKDVPLPVHANAQKAAEAAHCAGSQGKYWEYHDVLFASKQLELPKLKEHARTLKLNAETFDKCVDSGQFAGLVKSQFEEAQALGLPGTPAFFVNGRFLNPNGKMSYQTLRQVVEEELALSQERRKDSVPVNR